jgi:hypothetical protein
VRGAGAFVQEFGPGLEAAIDQTLGTEPFQRRAIVVQMVGLAADRRFPGYAQPGQVFENGRLEFGAAAGGVDVFDTQDEAVARACRGQRRIGVAAMQIAARRRRKAGNPFSDGAAA